MKSLVGSLVNAAAKPTPDSIPVPYSPPQVYQGRYVGAGQRDRTQQLRAPEQSGLLFSIVNRTSTAVADLNWRLYRKTPNPDVTSERVEVQSHALLDLLRKPNAFMGGPILFERTQQHIDLTGEGYWVVNKLGPKGVPLELWPVAPNHMEPIRHPTKFQTGWMYTGPSGEEIPLRLDEVIAFQMPNPYDIYRGLGPVQAMLMELDAYRYSVEWNRNFFLNSALPAGFIQVPKTLTDPEFDRLVNRWNEQHKGVSRAHRVGILEDATWADSQMSQRDMQFAELQTQSRDRLLEAFGISGAVMGVTDDVNRSNAEAGKAMFAELLTCPRGNRFRGQINIQLLPQFGAGSDTLEVDYDSPVPADVQLDNETRTSKANAIVALVEVGFDPDDVLASVEWPTMKYVGPPQIQQPTMLPLEPAGGAGAEPQDRLPAAHPAPLHHPRAAVGDDPDLSTVDQQWQDAAMQTVAAYRLSVLPAQRRQLVDDIRRIVDSGDLAALGELRVRDTRPGAALLFTAMVTLGNQAARTAANEAAQQGIGVSPTQPDQQQLDDVAVVVAALLAVELAVAAGREAMRIWRKGMTGQQVADQVAAYLDGLSGASLAGHIGGAMSAAEAAARQATFTAPHPETEPYGLYASEKRDKNTCEPCGHIDGALIGMSTDPDIAAKLAAVYPMGGYIDCQGGERCRGTVTAKTTPFSRPAALPSEPTGSALRRAWAARTRINGHKQGVGV